jgi:hypothetical protein
VGVHEDVLQNVLGVLGRAEDPAAERQQPGVVAVEEDLERAVVMLADQLDEPLVALQPENGRAPDEQPAAGRVCKGGGLHPFPRATRYPEPSCGSTLVGSIHLVIPGQ